jgi:hypothetical protein
MAAFDYAPARENLERNLPIKFTMATKGRNEMARTPEGDDDRNCGVVRIPGRPWRFSGDELRHPGRPAFRGEHNAHTGYGNRKARAKGHDHLRHTVHPLPSRRYGP